jgi:hypothetical protein
MKYAVSFSASLTFSMCSSPVGRTRSSWSVQSDRDRASGWAHSAEPVMTFLQGNTPPPSRLALIGPVSSRHGADAELLSSVVHYRRITDARQAQQQQADVRAREDFVRVR